jgi:arylsulfatase A-like enzyme
MNSRHDDAADDHRPGRTVTRRGALGLGAAAATAVAAGGRASARAADPRRLPNILWLVSEDNIPLIGAYGDRLARTPTIDRLAGDGVLFENAYSLAPVCAPSRFGLITAMHPETSGPGEHHRAEALLAPGMDGFPILLRELGYYCTNQAKTDYNAPLVPRDIWDASGARAHWQNRPAGAPFFAVFNDNSTHESSMFGPYQPGITSPDDVELPAYHPDTRVMREDRARYYDRIADMDGNLAVRLRELEDAGLADDTIVFYYSDNGGVLPRSKRFCYDSGLHTPLVVRFGRRWSHLSPYRHGARVSRLVSGVDLPATVLGLAGAQIPPLAQGISFLGPDPQPRRYAFSMRNRMDETYDMQRTVRDGRYRYIRNYMPHRIYGQHVVYQFRQAGYLEWRDRYVAGELDEVQSRFWRRKPAEELYDLNRDPDEIHDLAGDPNHARSLDRLRAALDDHLREVNDNGFIPEGSPLEGYEPSRRPGAFPIDRVLDVAGRAIQDDPGQSADLVAALDDPNEVVRYWAALGAAVLGSRVVGARERLASALATDPSVHVRLQAAEALVLLDDATALEWLGATLTGHEHPRVRLQAANALAALGLRSRPVADQIRQATVDADNLVATKATHALDVIEGRAPELG